jgi:hypothetical protein
MAGRIAESGLKICHLPDMHGPLVPCIGDREMRLGTDGICEVESVSKVSLEYPSTI